MHKQENIFFLVMLMSILFFGIIPFFKTESLTSASENRTLATFEHFDIESFSNGSFQSNFESALSDQFVLSEEIRTAYNKIFNNFSVPILSNQICKNNYLEFSGGTDYRRATFNCEDYILYYPEPLTKIQAENIAINIQKYNRVNQLTDTYYYIIQDSSAYNYKTNQPIIDYEELLKESLTGNYHLSSLDTSTYDSFKSYFYKTDHHWNHYGSYQGYLDIVNLLNLSPPPLAPTGTFTNHEYYFGSHAQMTKNYAIEEEFQFYTFNIPSYTTIINGKPATYGNYQDYINHNYTYDKTTNYYSYFYGDDKGEIIYNFQQPDKPNLLIFSNSFSNPINHLIASHFNKTYVIDLRHYKNAFNQDFSLSSYLVENNIDKTLFIMNPTFIYGTATNQGLEL